MKKRIGISFTASSYENYRNWFTPDDLSADLELVELSFQRQNYADVFTCDGIVLTGGIDVHPSFYKGAEQYANRPETFQEDRDRFEAYLYHYGRSHRLPILAICRGMQLVNVLEGGSLVQDLAEQGNAVHRKVQTDREHEIELLPGTHLATLTGQLTGKVNSAHHQCVLPGKVADCFAISAKAKDGTPEALEWKDPAAEGFLLAVQWHPERMEQKERNPFSQNLKAAFLHALRKTADRKLTIINPATGTMLTRIQKDDEASIRYKFLRLQEGQQKWSAIPLQERIRCIRNYSGLLESKLELLATTLTDEVGKPLQQSRNEINGARARIAWLCDHASKYLADEEMSNNADVREVIRYEPLGVVGNISAWNYPYLVGTNVFIPALLAGNSVFYKPSEYAALTGIHIASLLQEAGIPDDAFQVAIGGASTGEYLLSLPLNGYFFTGSYKTGKYIYERVAPKMVPCQCELGGKDPLYVADDVNDIAAVAKATADGAFYNNGQSCCAVERIYVQEKVYDQYVTEFVKEVKSWKLGDPHQKDVYLGAVTRAAQLDVLDQQVADALQKGAQLLAGGKRIPGNGFFYEPTVLVNVTHQMEVMREESFGPIIGIMKVQDDEKAVNLMKDTAYGLTAAVYSSNQARAEKILEKIDAGTGYWNCCDRVSAALPWSGRKHSGFGATLSHAGLRAFTHPKAYHFRTV